MRVHSCSLAIDTTPFFDVELLLLCQCYQQTTQQARSSTKQHKSSAYDEDALVSEMLGGVSHQPTVASGRDQDLFSPKVSC